MTINKLKIKTFCLYILYSVIVSIINIIVYYILFLINNNILFCNTVAYVISIFVQFVVNKKRVFKNNSVLNLHQILKFMITKMVSLFIDSLVLYVMIKVLNINVLVSKTISNCSTTFSNYYLLKLWVFKKTIGGDKIVKKKGVDSRHI